MSSLRILTLNTFGAPFLSKDISKRFRLLAEEFSDSDPDILCLQEVVLYPHLRLLKKLLPQYSYCLYKKFLYGPKGGLVIFSKFPVRETRFIDFTKRGSVRNKSLVGRIMRYGVLSVQLEDIPVTICTTHLTPNSDIEYSESNRFVKYHIAQLQQLTEIIHKERLWKRGIILTGDFNIPAGSYLYDNFIEASGMTDLFSGKHESTYHHEYLPKGKRHGQIDYILASSPNHKLKKLSAEYILQKPYVDDGHKLFLSDHIGLIADLKVTSAEKSYVTN